MKRNILLALLTLCCLYNCAQESRKKEREVLMIGKKIGFEPSPRTDLFDYYKKKRNVAFINYVDGVFPNDSIMDHDQIEYIFLVYEPKAPNAPLHSPKLCLNVSKLQKLPKLQCLEIVGYDLSCDMDSLFKVPNLRALSLNNCFLTDQEMALKDSSGLYYLDLSFNFLSDISIFSKDKFPQLRWLNLTRNNIRTLEGLSQLGAIRGIAIGNGESYIESYYGLTQGFVKTFEGYNTYDVKEWESELNLFLDYGNVQGISLRGMNSSYDYCVTDRYKNMPSFVKRKMNLKSFIEIEEGVPRVKKGYEFLKILDVLRGKPVSKYGVQKCNNYNW